MSFRLRIFLLVMGVAVTAIVATGWLTLSLSQREVVRAQRAQVEHQQAIIDEIQDYGFRAGNWPGVDRVVADLAKRTDLHIQVRTDDGTVLADSDTLEQRVSGPVSGGSVGIDPRLPLAPDLGGLGDDPETTLASGMLPSARGGVVIRVAHPQNLFGPNPTDDTFGTLPALVVRRVAQYRAALVTIRCLHEKLGRDATLTSSQAPYLTPAEIAADPACTRAAVRKVLNDRYWLDYLWVQYARCSGGSEGEKLYRSIDGGSPVTVPNANVDRNYACLNTMFTEGVGSTTAIPLKLYLGHRVENDVGQLRSPALVGLAGLIVVALIGTALIARRVSRPVHQLTEASRLLADGRLDVRVPTRGTSELSRLSESFNAMAEAVQRSEERQRRLVADVAHELRTPLSNLRGYLEGLSDGVVEPSRELFVSLHEETLLQRRILDDLQVLALAEAGDLAYAKTAMDLSELAASGSTAHRAVAAEAGVAMTVDAPAPVWIQGDPDRLRQVLGNLLTNAIRYTDRDGHVLIKVRVEGGEAMLTVQDTGVGIAPDDLAKVFDRFWRADPTRQRATGGTGLGLTIAHRIVADHDGRIEVTSKEHLGTTFVVHLPV